MIDLFLRSYPKTFYNSSLLDPTLDCIFQLLRESEESDEEMDSAHTAGTSLLDAVCIHLPMKLVYPPLKERVIQHLDRPEVACKKAGLSAIVRRILRGDGMPRSQLPGNYVRGVR